MASFYRYNKGDHPAGFVGLRCIDGGQNSQLRSQLYLSFKKHSESEALTIAKEWCRVRNIEKRERALKAAQEHKHHYKKEGGDIIRVRYFQLVCAKGYPTLVYQVSPLARLGSPMSRQGRVRDSIEFDSVYERLVRCKVNNECANYHGEWIDYYMRLKPHWDDVEAYMRHHYPDAIW